MRRRLWIGVVAAGLVAQLMAVVPAGAAEGYTATGRLVQLFSAANMKRQSFSQVEAVDVANRFDVISASPDTFRTHVGAMKEANPDLKLLVYLNGTFAQKGEATAFPESWYLRDAVGNKVTSVGYGNYAMNPSDVGWIDNRAKECASRISYSNYDGCFYDMLGTAPLDPGYLTALPINPATGKVWTRLEWLNAAGHLAAKAKVHVGAPTVAGNGLGNGNRYFDATAPSQKLLDSLEGGIAEAWLRAPAGSITSYRPEASWKHDVDMLVDAGPRGESVLTMTKVWTSGTTAQKDAWHKYALASFLLGTDGSAYFSFLRDNSPTDIHPWDQVDVGSPLGGYAKRDGVYQRDFSAGLAMVNPTTSTVKVSLDGTYVTLDGAEVTSLTMAPNTGEVLKRLKADPAPARMTIALNPDTVVPMVWTASPSRPL
jgi:hypothetical protein